MVEYKQVLQGFSMSDGNTYIGLVNARDKESATHYQGYIYLEKAVLVKTPSTPPGSYPTNIELHFVNEYNQQLLRVEANNSEYQGNKCSLNVSVALAIWYLNPTYQELERKKKT